MKRVPPVIGFVVFEKEDIEKLSHEERMQLLAVQVATLGLALGVIAIAIWWPK